MKLLTVLGALALVSAASEAALAEIKAPVQDGKIDLCMPKSVLADKEMYVKKRVHIIVCFNVGKDGKPKDITIANSGGSVLDQEAVNCVNEMRYKPATRDGEPMDFPLVTQMNWCGTSSRRMPDCPPLPITAEHRAICARGLHLDQSGQ